MPFEINLHSSSRPAGADLSAKQYYFVTLNSSGQVILPTATTDVPYGILQNAPGSAQAATVMRAGISRLVAGGSIAIGTNGIGTDATGKGTTYAAGVAGTAAYPVAFCEEGCTAANQIITVSLNALGDRKRSF